MPSERVGVRSFIFIGLFLRLLLPSIWFGVAAAQVPSFHEYFVAAGSTPIGITGGPDGALWFTEFSGNMIGRITSAGALNEYPTPSAGPYRIAVGSDGALWFTEYYGGKIGRVITSGAFTEYATPSGFGPYGITAGSEGALWFTEYNPGKIGRITTTGVVTEFSPPTSSSFPLEIAAWPGRSFMVHRADRQPHWTHHHGRSHI